MIVANLGSIRKIKSFFSGPKHLLALSANGKSGIYVYKDYQEPSVGKRYSFQDDAMGKKNCKQESSAINSMKQCSVVRQQ
jgi:hypothetical protein